jgi:predicted ABC-type ATPase
MNAHGRAQPLVVIIAGPNGAGKSTVAPRLLCDALGVGQFVTADTIARGLHRRMNNYDHL